VTSVTDAESLFAQYYDRLLGYLTRVAGEREAARDLTQEVFLWLVQRLADGKERTQALSLRGLYYQPIPFYFDTVTEGAKAADLFGDLQISPGERTNEIKITTRSRVTPSPVPHGYYVGSSTGTLQVVPGEVVSVPLPAVSQPRADAGAFTAGTLSFRIRVRQIR
jgi:Sigma-70 region 2